MVTTRQAGYELAKAKWQGVRLSYEHWCSHLDAHGWLDQLPPHIESLFLCSACARGDEEAFRTLGERYFPYLRGVIAKVDAGADFVEQALDATRHLLLEGPARKIATYTGNGRLVAWLRIIAHRVALSQKRSLVTSLHTESVLDELWNEATRQVSGANARRSDHARVFERCVRDVLQMLPLVDRTLVRLYYLEGSDVDSLGRMYGKDSATAALWLKRCRERMQTELKQRIHAEFAQLSPGELASLARFVQLEIDLSVSVLLEADRDSRVSPPDLVN
jgi:RNA polymerase sigma-70 factor